MRQGDITRMRNAMLKKQIGTNVNDTAALLQKAIRMEAADDDGMVRCVTCGKRVHYTACDGGHYLSRKDAAVIFEETNIHPQCKSPCNRPPPYGLAGNPESYTRYMENRYGQAEIDRLKALKRTIRQWTIEELLALKIEYKKRIAIQMERLG